MPRKFVYAPGLPGYGTRGVDGSAGLVGLTTYFSAYDGNSDSVTIKSKIINNFELFATSNYIPGYPTRTYQTGDIFIDKNARIFEIDFAEANLYKDTGIFLNTSGFFTEGPTQVSAPSFTRYSNSFETEKFLIDTVYTNSVGNYTQYPLSIYDNHPQYFSRVNYIGADVVVDLNGWYPFEVWTIGDANDDNAIGLSREENANAWHFGNWDTVAGTGLRDASLYLDFNDIYCPSIAAKTSEVDIIYWDNVSGKISQGPVPEAMVWDGSTADGAIGYYASGNPTSIYRSADFLWNDGSGYLQISGDIRLDDSASQILFESGTVGTKIQFNGQGGGYNGILTPSVSSTSTIKSGGISIQCGTGSGGSTNDGGAGGDLYFKPGDGGTITGGSYNGGAGGRTYILSGSGGNSLSGDANAAGPINLTAGDGGVSNAGGNGGNGGSITIAAGDGGFGFPSGDGGSVYINSGVGNANGAVYLQNAASGSTILGGTLITGSYIRIGTDGTASSPALGFSSQTNTGLWHIDNTYGQINVSLQGTTDFAFAGTLAGGDFYATGNVIAYGSIPSDIRLKEDIKLLENSLSKISKLNPISYVRKRSGEIHLGLIAQEVEKIIPEVVRETMILGEDESIKYKTINYDEIIPHLIGAIKEQQKRIEALEEKLNNQITK